MANNSLNLTDEIVSSGSEQLILVDENDSEVGVSSKTDCHANEGVLHRAFSLFIFNDAGELLLQRRSEHKPLWPMFWSNSCCSHPREGEAMEHAVHRRLEQELGLKTELTFLYKFKYFAPYLDVGAEREYCWIYAGQCSDTPTANSNEVESMRFVAPDDIDYEMQEQPEQFTPWFKLEWERVRELYVGSLLRKA